MSQTINITLNGQPKQIGPDTTVTELLTAAGIAPAHVAVELNGIILQRAEFATIKVAAAACVEIVHFVGGG